jgi:hypothetical protein
MDLAVTKEKSITIQKRGENGNNYFRLVLVWLLQEITNIFL